MDINLVEDGEVALLNLGYELPLYRFIAAGTPLRVNLATGGYLYTYSNEEFSEPLGAGAEHVFSLAESYIFYADAVSEAIGDTRIEILADGHLYAADLTFISLQLNVDVDRDGVIDPGDHRRGSWQWGSDGHGAAVLVNNDRDVAGTRFGWRDRLDDRRGGALDVEDLARLSLDVSGPPMLPAGYELRLILSDSAAAKLRVFSLEPGATRQLIGPGQSRKAIPYEPGQYPLAAEALQYPDYGFTGLINLRAILTRRGVPKGSDGVLLRVAPWLAVSPLNEPQLVYVGAFPENAGFRAELRAACTEAGVPCQEVPLALNGHDRWLQDEIEIGYSRVPTKTLPVVLDGPRDRELDDFAELALLGQDYGWVARTDEVPRGDSLNSFGNLDCSPPLPGYPLGRILFGGAGQSDDTRHMSKVVTDFLYAQEVQAPLELHSSWLSVGHVDEFLAFIPADNALDFRLVLASPLMGLRIAGALADDGHGAAPVRPGRTDLEGNSLELSLDMLLADEDLARANLTFQRNIDWNRALLKKELGIAEADIVDIPALYESRLSGADAFTANMANMVVLGSHLIVPKPFGPTIDGECRFERAFREKVGPGLTVHFIDTWQFYHLQKGGVHCGTNVKRGAHQAHWWEFRDTDTDRLR